jgi:hypothetical protein
VCDFSLEKRFKWKYWGIRGSLSVMYVCTSLAPEKQLNMDAGRRHFFPEKRLKLLFKMKCSFSFNGDRRDQSSTIKPPDVTRAENRKRWRPAYRINTSTHMESATHIPK